MRFRREMLFLLCALIMGACKEKQEEKHRETTLAGTTLLAADESFQPIVDQEAYVFEHLNTQARLDILYKPENNIVGLLLNDSVRLAILSRELSANELNVLKSKNLSAETSRFAIDAVALIVNKASKDTLITVGQLKDMLNGKGAGNLNIVFDNPNSSLVRYLKTLANTGELKAKNVYALKSNKEIIRYVSEHENAIGITGFSWLNDPDDDYADALSKVKIMSVKDESNKSNAYVKPSQETLALKQYPLIRNLYIVNCTGKMGLGTGFAYFMLGETGQRIILRSGLLPNDIPGREINIKKKY